MTSEDGVENIGVCMTDGCHYEGTITTFDRWADGDYDGDRRVEGIQDEIQGLLDILAEKLPQDDKGNVLSNLTDVKTTEAERQALWELLPGEERWQSGHS